MPVVTLGRCLRDPNLFARHFRGESWAAWKVFLAALFAEPADEAGLAVYRERTGPRQVDAGEGRTDVSPADFTEPMGLQCLLLLDLRISGVPDICGAFFGRLDLAEGRGHPASASGRTRVDIETSSLLSG
jgi:hypothetical protein